MWDGEVEERENGELWGKSNYCGKWFPLLSTAIHAGLFHPNCRHTILLYRDGDPLPKALDNSEIEKRYKLEQKQRRLENEVRRAQRRAEGFSDPDNIKKAKKEVREAQEKLREFIDQVNKEYGKIVLGRDYGREKIYDEGKAVEASETAQGAYQDEKIPERFAGKEITIPITNKTQDYRPIQFNKEDEMKVDRASEITLHRVDTAVNNVYISDNVKIKPKKLHEIDRNITEVFDKMRISDKDNLPPVLVVSSEDMATSAVASYNAKRNVLFINEKYSVYDKANVPEIMEQLTCGENDLSSYIHEIYHWIDAEKFRKRFGAVTDGRR